MPRKIARMRRTATAPTPAAAEPACVCNRLRRASRALTQLYDDALAGSGLRVTQFSLLRNLSRMGPVRMSDFAAKLLVDRTALTRTLDPLVAAGYVAVARGRDARTREISITLSGCAAVAAGVGGWKRVQSDVARTLGPARLAGLVAALADLESLHPDAAAASLKESP